MIPLELKPILILMIGMLTLSVILSIVFSKATNTPRKDDCPPHEWKYEVNHLICQKCRMPAGYPNDRMD
jgi:hypothetical protein